MTGTSRIVVGSYVQTSEFVARVLALYVPNFGKHRRITDMLHPYYATDPPVRYPLVGLVLTTERKLKVREWDDMVPYDEPTDHLQVDGIPTRRWAEIDRASDPEVFETRLCLEVYASRRDGAGEDALEVMKLWAQFDKITINTFVSLRLYRSFLTAVPPLNPV